MTGVFPQKDWLDGLVDYLNSSEKYARIAKNWEGDLIFQIKAEAPLDKDVVIYLDLWHGQCRSAKILPANEPLDAAFILSAPYGNFVRVLKGELDPMQAMMTRKLTVQGNMGYMMRHVPTVLEFVRSAQASTDRVLGE
ncbi:SCP2 sterol-binding domain-containing protein [bacterium]|nr:SCP2 sterol-binding domain-containing protein [bacterium]